jgi:hypothetical protein
MATRSSREIFIEEFAALDQTRVQTKRMEQIAEQAFELADNAQTLAAEALPNDPHLTDVGKLDRQLKTLEKHFVDIERSRHALEEIRENAHAFVSRLNLPARDKSDSTGELRDQELRAYVRGLPQEKRDRTSNLSPDMIRAIVSAPPELSGVALPSTQCCDNS